MRSVFFPNAVICSVGLGLLLAGCPTDPAKAPGPGPVALSDAGGQTTADAGLAPDNAPAPEHPTPPCAPGVSCDDFDPCTTDDRCTDGVCQGTPYSCEDTLECTRGICDGQGGCSQKVISGDWCFIAGACYADGAPDPQNVCQGCVTPKNPSAFTPMDGGPCDDDQECTAQDRCQGGACVGQTNPCEDDNPCTTNGCIEGQGCVHAAVAGPCEDGDFCTVGDTCTGKICTPGPATLDCNDGDPCTTDVCTQTGGCSHVSGGGPCEDGDPCTLGDECLEGQCQSGPQSPSCDDQNPCTNDSCLHNIGCVHIPNLNPCDDGNVCTVGDTCSNTLCTPGHQPKDCDDGEPCTQDFCEGFVGCTYTPLSGFCDDGNPCTENDTCNQSVCQGGTQATCDDQNPCTDDVCNAKVAGGCVFVPNAAPCDDGEPCTEGDVCQGGACTSTFASCDDQNPCTVDSCEGALGCKHVTDVNQDACLLSIVITSPKRGQAFSGSQQITIKGYVQSPSAAVTSATISSGTDPSAAGDAIPLELAADGSFSLTVAVQHGLNLYVATVQDALGNTDKTIRGFYYSTQYRPMSAAQPAASSVDKGLYIFLGPGAIDDDNHTLPANDLATIFELIMGSFDIGALLPNPLVSSGQYDVNMSNVSFDPARVSLFPEPGGMQLYASITNLYAAIHADGKCFLCPSASGQITVSEILIITDIGIATVNGQPKATLQNTQVLLIGPNVDINGILGSLLDFIVDFVVDQLAPTIEDAFKAQLGGIVPQTVEAALASMAFNTSFEVPPFFDGAPAIGINLATGLENIYFDAEGGVLRLWAAATTPKNTTLPSPGVLMRNGCLGGIGESLALSKSDPLQIALSDDLINQILYSMWWGGGLSFPMPPALLAGVDLSQFSIEDLSLTAEFLLPPIVSACNPYEDLVLQIGGIRMEIEAKLFGKPVQLVLFAALEAFMDLQIGDAGLGLSVTDLKTVATEVEVKTPGFGTAEALVDSLIGEQLAPLLLQQLGGGALGGFPLPAIDLSGLAAGVPPGTEIAIDPQSVTRSLGWTVVGGGIK